MPERIEDYEVLGVIGTGSYGTCYKVRKKNTPHVFVWKAVDYGSMSVERKKLLVSEVNVLRELKHPNIVRYYDRIIHKESATIYIIMEWCEGGDLATLIKKCLRSNKHIEESFIWRVLYQSSRALQACYLPGHPILHRDIKPANLFLDSHFNVKLGDFGLARVLKANPLEEENAEDFCAQTVVGTPFYMSPEVVKGNKYNRKSDVWSLGCVIYELCSLFPPFVCHNVNTLAKRIKEGRFSRIPCHYSDELHQVVVYMLTVDHDVRPSIETILHHPSVVSHIAQWSFNKPIYEKQNRVSETNQSENIIEAVLNETFCSCIDDCCAEGRAEHRSSISTQNVPTGENSNIHRAQSKSDQLYRIPTYAASSLVEESVGHKSKRNSTKYCKTLAEKEERNEINPVVKQDDDTTLVERFNMLRQREAKLRMRELTLEERERNIKKKEREAALASRLARETMGRASVYLKNCRENRGSTSSTVTKMTIPSSNQNENLNLIVDADSSLDQELGETSAIAMTSAKLDPRTISKPWHRTNSETRKVTFSSRNSQTSDGMSFDYYTVDNTKNAGILATMNGKEAPNLRTKSWWDSQSWLENKWHAYKGKSNTLGKENKVPSNERVLQGKTSLPHLENLPSTVKTLR